MRVFYTLLLLSLIGCNPAVENNEKLATPKCVDGISTCELMLDDGKLLIQSDQTKFVSEQPFNLFVQYIGAGKLIKLDSYLEGKSMYMGKIPLFFVETSTKNWLAEAMVGSCSQQNMQWWLQLNISLKKGNEIIEKQLRVTINTYN